MTYFVEKEGSQWTFLDSFWYSLMTLTTVGYELQPQSTSGKLVGGLCALLGIFILTLPLPIVVNSFSTIYKNRSGRSRTKQWRFLNILTPGCGGMRWPPRKPRSWSRWQTPGRIVSMMNTSGGNYQAWKIERDVERGEILQFIVKL